MDMVGEAKEDTILRLHEKYGVQFDSILIPNNETLVDDTGISLTERIFPPSKRAVDPKSLAGRFENLMLEEKIFLQQGLTLEEVAERLNSNKTYVSKMVNSNYGMGFPELINSLRTNFAQEYLIQHADARQEDIAKVCGFPSASSFNNIFKKITGLPPRIWLAKHEQRDS